VATRIAIWSAVPGGSTISISLKGTSKKKLVTGHAFLLRGDGLEESIPDSLLQPGPHAIDLETPHTYSILTDLVYTTSGTAEVMAQVIGPRGRKIAPDGSPDPTFKVVLAGSQGQTLGVTFIVITV
jgi:hypothetical protein